MGYPASQISIPNSLLTVESAPSLSNRLKRLDTSLLIETALITIAAILTIRILAASSISRAAWFLPPVTLVAAALIPTAIKRCSFPNIGFNIKQIRLTILLVCLTCAVVFPALFAALALSKVCGAELPLRPVLPHGQRWVCWLFYQFMYIAVAEEVFFRGFLQTNILRSTNKVMRGQRKLQQWISIGVSAACFAAAHIIIQGQVISVLTFLPGLILGWLFIRTKSLLAPILFHGLANTYYFWLAAVLA